MTTSLPEIAVSVAAVRLGAADLAVGNVLGSNLFNLLILGLADLFYLDGPLLADSEGLHGITVLAVVAMYALTLVSLTRRVPTKRFIVTWDSGAIAVVYAVAVTLTYVWRA